MSGAELYLRATGTWPPSAVRAPDGRSGSADAFAYPVGEKVTA
ncbi:hypothetical protein [Streptomyces sp. NPDC008137]